MECDEVDHACRTDRAEAKGRRQKTSKELIWHLFNMDDPTEFAGRFHRLILHGLSLQDDK